MERRVIETGLTEEDVKLEGSLRPQYLKDYIGQKMTIIHISEPTRQDEMPYAGF